LSQAKVLPKTNSISCWTFFCTSGYRHRKRMIQLRVYDVVSVPPPNICINVVAVVSSVKLLLCLKRGRS